MVNLDDIQTKVSQGKQIEEIVRDVSWQDFEELVARIFKKHDYDVFKNFRFKHGRRYEIDLLCIKNNSVIAIDCKHWGRGRYKKSALKSSILSQAKRGDKLKKILVGDNIKIIPLIVTLFEEEIISYNNMLIVPLWKLNDFLLNTEHYESTADSK